MIKATNSPTHTDIAASFGILNTFRLSPAWDLNLDIRGTLVSDEFDGEVGKRGGEGLLAATVGFTYKFKKRGWDRPKTVPKTVIRTNVREIEDLNRQLADMQAENERLKKALAEQKPAREIVNKVVARNLVIFRIGRSELSNEARANLSLLAEAIKKGDSDAVYTITGYADAQRVRRIRLAASRGPQGRRGQHVLRRSPSEPCGDYRGRLMVVNNVTI